VRAELISWRNKLSHVSSKFDTIPSIDKYKLTPQIEGLHIVLAELEDRIHALESECPTAWRPFSEETGVSYEGLDERFNQAEGIMHDYSVGG
jgi:hypothetical protein